MDKKAEMPVWVLIALAIALALIVWYIFFSGSISAQAKELIRGFMR